MMLIAYLLLSKGSSQCCHFLFQKRGYQYGADVIKAGKGEKIVEKYI